MGILCNLCICRQAFPFRCFFFGGFYYPTLTLCPHPPCGGSRDRPLPDATLRREDMGAEEGPCLTTPENDSLLMLCRVTSANHNNSFTTLWKCATKNRAMALFRSHNEATGYASSQREWGRGKMKREKSQLCSISHRLNKHLYYTSGLVYVRDTHLQLSDSVC